MKAIVYSCPYVPAEWIAAHGLHPSRIMPSMVGANGPLALVEGLCPYVHSFINEVATDKNACAVIVTTLCDQMRRAFDILTRRCDLPAFLMNVPHTWQTLAAQKMYIDELRRLGRFLVRLGGKPPSDQTLAEIMLAYDSARKSIIESRNNLSARHYAKMIAALNRDGPSNMPNKKFNTQPLNAGIPLAIVGGPLVKQDIGIFDIIEQCGGLILLDATETGERGMPAPFDRRGLRDNPLMELARAYFGGIPDASRRPNTELYNWLKQKLTDRAVRGIIFRRYVWCDTWHAELSRLKEWTNLPVLDIDVGSDSRTHQVRTPNRIRAFLEMFQ